jgi:iron complex transport system ATP-binding protein
MTPLLEFRDVAFAYPAPSGQRTRPFRLDALSFTVAPGEVLGVIGPNSSGKTTLIRLLTDVVRPRSGQVLLDGRPTAALGRRALAREVATVPQHVPQAFPFTVGELVLMGRYPHGGGRYFETPEDRDIAREAMAATGVLDLAGLPLDELSGGERQRAVLARALAQRPRLLVLDEPTAHLDLRHQAESAALLRRLQRERGMTVLLVAHDLDLAAEVADRLLLLADGRIARLGPPEAVLEESLLESVYGCPVSVDKHPTTRRPSVHIAWRPTGGGAEGR